MAVVMSFAVGRSTRNLEASVLEPTLSNVKNEVQGMKIKRGVWRKRYYCIITSWNYADSAETQ